MSGLRRGGERGWPAMFSGGECPECDTPIREGDRIERGDEGYRHVVCPPERPSRFQGTTDEEMGF